MFYVSISNVAIEKVRTHAQENVEKEVIGLLTGRMEDSVLVIEDAITGEMTSSETGASLTPEAMAKIADRIIRGEVQGNIVGWYHSHPGFGVFISDIDMRTQMKLQQFSPYIVSLVIDPTRNEIGFFTANMHTKSPVLISEEYTHMFNPGEEAIPLKFQEQTLEEFYPYTQPDRGIDRRQGTASRDAKKTPASRKPKILFIIVTLTAIACIMMASLLILLPRTEGARAYIIIDSPKNEEAVVWNDAIKVTGGLFIATNDTTATRLNANVTLSILTVFSPGNSKNESQILEVLNGSFQYELTWPSTASITLQASLNGTDKYAPASSEVRFKVGKRNTNLTIDTSKPSNISGTLMDTHGNGGIANATVHVSIEGEKIWTKQTDQDGKYEIPWDYSRKRSGNYSLLVEFEDNDFYNASRSDSKRVYPNTTITELRPLPSSVQVNLKNTGFLLDNITVVLKYYPWNPISGEYDPDPVPGINVNKTYSLSPNETKEILLDHPKDLDSGKYRVTCAVTSNITDYEDDDELTDVVI